MYGFNEKFEEPGQDRNVGISGIPIFHVIIEDFDYRIAV